MDLWATPPQTATTDPEREAGRAFPVRGTRSGPGTSRWTKGPFTHNPPPRRSNVPGCPREFSVVPRVVQTASGTTRVAPARRTDSSPRTTAAPRFRGADDRQQLPGGEKTRARGARGGGSPRRDASCRPPPPRRRSSGAHEAPLCDLVRRSVRRSARERGV